eukprot:GHVS01095484.1.p1 GENE.GHVS01095484.1~~GHVS01095484.1.p1  ORF type:complete len:527 (-),score=52.84 GHVS01095484.1:249-1829(-)
MRCRRKECPRRTLLDHGLLLTISALRLMLVVQWIQFTAARHPHAAYSCSDGLSNTGHVVVGSALFFRKSSYSSFITASSSSRATHSRAGWRSTRLKANATAVAAIAQLWDEPCAPAAATAVDETPRSKGLWTGDIPKRYLGSSLMEVSPISLGTMTFGEQTNEEEAHNLLDFAVKDCGINLIDTAEMYPAPTRLETNGHTESIVGRWLQRNAAWRERIYIATKIAGPSYSGGRGGSTKDGVRGQASGVPNSTGWQKPECSVETQQHFHDSLLQSCEASLKRLKTDYIDLYQLHWPDRRVPLFGHTLYTYGMGNTNGTSFEDICIGIKALLESGKIRNWGVSNETPFGLAELVKCSDQMDIPRPVAIQTSFNLLHRAQFEDSFIESCAPWNYNVGLLSWSPLAGGMLTGKYLAAPKREPQRLGHANRFHMFPKFQHRWINSRCMEATARYSEIAEQAGLSLTALAILWILSREYLCHGSVILGATKQEQLEQCMKIVRNAKQPLLSEDVLNAVDAAHLLCRDPSQEL